VASAQQAAATDLTVGDRYDEDAARSFRARGWWRDGSPAALLDDWAQRTPDRMFVSDGTSELDYTATRTRAYGLGARLLAEGVRRGDRVVVQLPNWHEFVVSYLAIARIGAVMVPIMPVYRHTEVEHVLHNSGAVAAITAGTFRKFDHAGMFRTLREQCPDLATVIVVRGQAEGAELDFADACAGTFTDGELGEHADPDAPHVIVYTSGTESSAKGCVHTWNTLSFSGVGLARDVFEIGSDDVMFMPTPVAHATGLVVGVLAPLSVGAHTHLLDIWEPNEGLARIEKYRCTAAAASTPFVRMALDAAPGAGRDVSSMRFWLCAGAPVPEALAREFEEVFDGGILNPLYGCSEVMGAISCHRGDSIERRSGTAGVPALTGIQIKLVDAEGHEVGPDEEGEICYWGPGAILGYWRDPERTANAIDSDGWHHTGDLARKDAEGYIRISGRLKDIIIRGGTNISAAEIEGYVASHPDVDQVAVVPYPDERLGEKACAVVVPKAGTEPSLQDITGFLRERRISMQKLPERLVLVEELPLNATGKVQKFLLRDLARDAAEPS
jgi:acyl-CoA synthetase (AMP-forming)/AMP-acid ligase II